MMSQRIKSVLNTISLCLCLALVVGILPLPVQAVAADEEIALRSDTQQLEDLAQQFWLRVNDARRDPLATVARLGLDEELVRDVFADQQWILDNGLQPLAWQQPLVDSALGHGRDMFTRLFYSYVTPDNVTVDQRIAATGYLAASTGETMNALFFENYIALDFSFDLLVDTMLRDELTGNPSVPRNIFSPEMTEMGATLFAESIEALEGQPLVYLLLADFAAPQNSRRYVIGECDASSVPLIKPFVSGLWSYVPLLAPGLFQIPYPEGGAEFLVIIDYELRQISDPVSLFEEDPFSNAYIDLRIAE